MHKSLRSYKPVREVADACRTGAATDIIFGLALGYKSCIIPAFVMAVAIYISNSLAGALKKEQARERALLLALHLHCG